jgi:hypothetical protein
MSQQEKFEKSASDLQDTLKYMKELQELLDDQDFTRREEIVNDVITIHEKLLRSQKNMEDTNNKLESTRLILEEEIHGYYGNVVTNGDIETTPPDIDKVIKTYEELKEKVIRDKENLRSLRKKKREADYLEKEFQLQKSALPIHFDEKSTKNDVRGCIQSAYSCILLYSLPFLSLTYFY